MGGLKDTLKKLFGRRKKKTAITTPSSSHPTSTTTDKAPQLPPLQTGQNPIDITNKPLPPTHPLATGEQNRRQLAVPQKAAAQLGLAPARNTRRSGSLLVEDNLLQRQQTPGELATGPPSTKNEGGKDDISVRSFAEVPPLPPPKEDITGPLVTKEQTHVLAAIPVHRDTPHTSVADSEEIAKQTQSHVTASDQALPAAVQPPPPPTVAEQHTSSAPRQDVPPSSTTVDSATSHTITTPATEQTNGSPNRHASVDDGKMLLMEEPPPPIRPINVAPGMSATSGPLEDFPEGGEL